MQPGNSKKKPQDDMDLISIGKRLRSIREEHKLTLVQISEIIGFSKSQIGAAEKGEKKPSAVYLYGLNTKFNVNVNYVLTGTGEPYLDNRNKSDEEKDISELFQLMKKIKMLRYAVLGYYEEYKKRNKDIVREFNDEQ